MMTAIISEDGTAEVPVAAGEELGFDDIADEHILTAAQQLGDKEAGYGRQEHQGDAAENTGQAQPGG